MAYVSQQDTPGVRLRHRGRPLILTVVLIASILDLLDATIAQLAAPSIARSIGGGEVLIQWSTAAYALALGVLLTLGGRLGDRFGRRRLFLTGLAGFVLASVACGVAADPVTFLISRGAQGGFGALLIPQGLGILLDVYPGEERAKAFALFGPVMGLSTVAGPILAGALIHTDPLGLGWRSIFLINLVIGTAGLLVAARVLPHDTGGRKDPVDVTGAIALAVAMLGLLGGLITGANQHWDTIAIALLVTGVLAGTAFVWRQRTAPMPLLDRSLFRSRGFVVGLIVGVVFFASVSGILFGFSLHLQLVLLLNPLNTSLTLAAASVGIAAGSAAGYSLRAKLGRGIVTLGVVVTLLGVLGYGLAAWGWPTSPWPLIAPLLVAGTGMGFAFGSIFDFTLGDVDPAQAGSASGALNSVQQLASAIGSAVTTTVFFACLNTARPANAALITTLTVSGMLLAAALLTRGLPRHALPAR